MHSSLLQVISKKVALTEKDRSLCTEYFEFYTGERKELLEKADTTPKYLYFISSGYMRLFYLDDNGLEVTTRLSGPNDFIAAFLALINQTRSSENIECITRCDLLRITRENMIELINKSERFKIFSLILFEQAVASGTKRADELTTLDAEKRYRKLMEDHPDLLQHIPIQYVASYLGVKPQSLSRIRSQISL